MKTRRRRASLTVRLAIVGVSTVQLVRYLPWIRRTDGPEAVALNHGLSAIVCFFWHST
jgi:hypothetical protein